MSDRPTWGTPPLEDPPVPGFVADELPTDDRLVDFLLAEVKNRHGVNLAKDEVAMLRLRGAAGQAQAELASAPRATVCLRHLAVGKNGPIHLELELTRDQLREITHPVAQSASPTRSADPPARRRRRVGQLVVGLVVAGTAVGLVVAVLLGAGRLFQRLGSHDVWSATNTPQVIDDLVEAAGGTQFVRVDLDVDRVFATAPTTPGATTLDDFRWSGGHAKREGPAYRDWGEPFDVTTVDWTKIEGFVAQASELSVLDVTRSTVDVRHARGEGASAVEISLTVCDDYRRCDTITANRKGEIVWVESDVEESPAFEWGSAGLYPAERAQRAAAGLVEVAGSAQFVKIELDGDRLRAEAPAVPGRTRAGAFSWRHGIVEVERTSSGEADPAALVDIDDVDWTLVEGMVAQTREMTGIDDPSPEVSVYRPKQGQSYAEPVFEVQVYFGGDGDIVHFDMTGRVVGEDEG